MGRGCSPSRLGALLERRVAIHGTGSHTRQLRPVLASTPNVVAFLDDDPAKTGTELWGVPIVTPDRATSLGVTDVVISSWIHEDAIWARRGGLESAACACTGSTRRTPPRPRERLILVSAFSRGRWWKRDRSLPIKAIPPRDWRVRRMFTAPGRRSGRS